MDALSLLRSRHPFVQIDPPLISVSSFVLASPSSLYVPVPSNALAFRIIWQQSGNGALFEYSTGRASPAIGTNPISQGVVMLSPGVDSGWQYVKGASEIGLYAAALTAYVSVEFMLS